MGVTVVHVLSMRTNQARGLCDPPSVPQLQGLAPVCTLNYYICSSSKSCHEMPLRPVSVLLVDGALVGCPWALAPTPLPRTLCGPSSPGWPAGPDRAPRSQEEEERRHQELLQKRREEEQEEWPL